MAKKKVEGTPPKAPEEKTVPVPGAGVIRPAIADANGGAIPATDDDGRPLPQAGRGLPAMPPVEGLLVPVADAEALVAAFQQYVDLKDKLLRDEDYMWHVVWSLGDRQGRKVLDKGDEARAFAQEIQSKGFNEVKLEKKIKKSGCLKLGKAFGISTAIIDMWEDRREGTAAYKVRAIAPNGQYKDRTGSCDRKEKGRADRPFDTISATALTRAENRAIMALVGGENTSEEFEDEVEVKDAEVKEVGGGPGREAAGGAPAPAGGAVAPHPDCPVSPSMTHEEALKEIDKKFVSGETKPAAALDERTHQMRRFWALLRKMYPTESGAKEVAHAVLKRDFKKESFKEATTDEIKSLADRVEKALAAREGGR